MMRLNDRIFEAGKQIAKGEYGEWQSGMFPKSVDELIYALKSLEIQHQLLAELCPDGLNESHFYQFLIVDKDMKCLYASKNFSAIFNLEVDDIIGKHWTENDFNIESLLKWDDLAYKALNSGKVYREIFPSPSKLLPGRFYECALIPYPSECPEAIFTTILDVTDIQQACTTLSNKNSHFNQIIESCPLGIMVADKNGRIEHINSEMNKYVRKLDTSSAVGKSIIKLCEEVGYPYKETLIYRALNG